MSAMKNDWYDLEAMAELADAADGAVLIDETEDEPPLVQGAQGMQVIKLQADHGFDLWADEYQWLASNRSFDEAVRFLMGQWHS